LLSFRGNSAGYVDYLHRRLYQNMAESKWGQIYRESIDILEVTMLST
jgi:hypothetical protein